MLEDKEIESIKHWKIKYTEKDIVGIDGNKTGKSWDMAFGAQVSDCCAISQPIEAMKVVLCTFLWLKESAPGPQMCDKSLGK